MREKPQRRCLHDFIGKKAFAIISRSAKSLGNLLEIKTHRDNM